MRFHLRMFAAGLVGTGLIVASLVPGNAATQTYTAGSATATIDISDATFDGSECMKVPYTVVFSEYGSLDIKASIAGSSNYLMDYAYGTGTVRDDIQVCPNIDGAGTYVLRGEFAAGDAKAEFNGPSFTVSQAVATITSLKAKQKRTTITVTGKATAPTTRGAAGASGTLTIYAMLPKSKGGKGKTRNLGTAYPDQFGAFTFTGFTTQRLKGATVTAKITQGSWSGDTQASTRLR